MKISLKELTVLLDAAYVAGHICGGPAKYPQSVYLAVLNSIVNRMDGITFSLAGEDEAQQETTQ